VTKGSYQQITCCADVPLTKSVVARAQSIRERRRRFRPCLGGSSISRSWPGIVEIFLQRVDLDRGRKSIRPRHTSTCPRLGNDAMLREGRPCPRRFSLASERATDCRVAFALRRPPCLFAVARREATPYSACRLTTFICVVMSRFVLVVTRSVRFLVPETIVRTDAHGYAGPGRRASWPGSMYSAVTCFDALSVFSQPIRGRRDASSATPLVPARRSSTSSGAS